MSKKSQSIKEICRLIYCTQCYSTLHKVDGTMKTRSYLKIHQIHHRWLNPGHKWIFHQDSDPKNTSELVWECIQQATIKLLE